jgi:hypothetical protein
MAYAPVTGWRPSCRSCRVVHAGEGHAGRLRKAFSGLAHYLARWRLEAYTCCLGAFLAPLN